MARHICEPSKSQERSRGRDEKNNTWEVSHESRKFCHRHLEKQYWAAFETMHVGRTLFFWPKKNLPFFDDSFKLALQIYKLMTLVSLYLFSPYIEATLKFVVISLLHIYYIQYWISMYIYI